MKWIVDVDENYTFTIPDEAIEKLGWKEGDLLDFTKNDDGSISIVKVE